MKYFYPTKFFNYLITLCGLLFSGLIVHAQVLNSGVYDWEGFNAGEVHAISTNTAPATWEVGNGFSAIATGNGNGSQIRVLIGTSLSTKVLRYDALAGATLHSATLKSTSGDNFGIRQFNIWPTQNETQMIEIYVKRDGVLIDTIRTYYQPTIPIHKIAISSSDYPFLANMDELEIVGFNIGVMLDDIEVMTNQAPVAMDDAVSVREDTPGTGNVLTNDSDPEENALTASLVTAPVNGTIVLNADGSFTYTPSANFNGLDSLRYQVCDNGTPSRCDTAWAHFQIEAVNDAPVIVGLPADITVREDATEDALDISSATIMDVDAGVGQVSLTLDATGGIFDIAAGTGISITGHLTGKLTLTGNLIDLNNYINVPSNIYFRPDHNLSGDNAALVEVSINDNGNTGSGGANNVVVGTINIDITPVNDAPMAVDDAVSTAKNVAAIGNVLTNDTDPEGNVLTVSLVTAPVNGTVVLNANGSFTYTPNTNFVGLDSLNYQVCDNGSPSLCDTATVKFTVNSTNDAPVAVDDEIIVTENEPATGNVLTNDNDPDGNALTASLVTAPVNGTVVLNADGSFTYTPNSDFFGQDSVIYQVCDNGSPSLCDTATLRIAVTAGSPRINMVNTTASNGLYKLGDEISIVVVFNQIVVVQAAGGNPTLTLNTGVVNRDAEYVSGSGTDAITFNYTVQAGDLSHDLDYLSTTALRLNGAVIRNGALVDADLTLPNTGGPNSLAGQHDIVVDGVTPVSTLVIVPNNGYYRMGSSLNFTVNFNEPVTVSGNPYLNLTIGEAPVQAAYVAGSGTSTLAFSYAVQSGDLDLDGITLAGIIGNASVMQDAAGNEASAMLNNVPSTAGIFVNTIQPSVTLSTEASSPVSSPFTVIATFSEAVTGFTLEDIIGSNATLSNLQTNDNISYSFLVTPAAGGIVQIYIPADMAVNVGSNGNLASNTLSLQYATIITGITLDDGSFVYDGTAKSLAIAGTLPAGTSVSYENNSRTDVGTQEVTATISGDNYETLILKANLTITKAAITGISFQDGSFVYDGTAKSLAISGTLPVGTSVSYENNSRTDVGTQEVTATISGDNYETLVLKANLAISKATITGITLDDGSFVYDGTAKSLAISGTLPVGTSVSYENNSRTDVGTQEVSATISGDNYETLVLKARLTITKANITGVTLDDESFVYDGTAKSLAIAGTLPAGTSVSYENNSRTDVGTQEVTATINGANYTDLVLTANLTITKASIDDVSDITFVDGSFVYDGTAKSLAISGTLPVGTSVSYENNSRTDVGTQEVTATINGDNYETLVLKANLTITKAAITGISFQDGSFVYDGTAKSLAISGTLPVGTSVSYENNSRTDVGTQEVTATINGDNYETLVLKANLTISKAAITGISFQDGSFVYDGTAKSLAISGTLPMGTSVSYENNSRTDVGTQEVSATISGDNYETLVLKARLTITKTNITGVTLDDGSFVYDGTAKSLAISGALPVGTSVSYENNSRTDVGTQEVIATINGANYTDLVLTANLTIIKASITGLTLEDASFIYDGTAKSLAISGTLPVGTSVSYENNSRTDVGTQEVSATISGDNYETLVLKANLTISKATITGVTLEDGAFVYDGTAKSLAIAGTLPAGTSVSYENNSRTDVGTQEVTATISGDNYETLVLKANLAISKATITGVTLEDGAFVYDGTAKSLAISGTLPAGTSVSYEHNSRTDVGTQEVTATINGDNYETLVLKANLTITKAAITGISFQDGSFVYDGTAKSLAISGTLPAGTSVSYEHNSRTDVGMQEVTAKVSGSNYIPLTLKATLQIRTVERSIDFEELPEKTYGDNDFNLQATANSGEAVSYISSNTNVATISVDGRIHIVGAGETIITATVPDNANYNNKPTVSRKLIVKKASQEISFTELGEVARNVGSLPLTVSASSSLPIRLEVSDPQVATVSGTTLNVLRLGTVMITAFQEGDANYDAADPVSIQVQVIDKEAALPIKVHKALSPNGDGINDFLMIEGVKDYPDNKLIIVDRNGMQIIEMSGYNNEDKVFRRLGPGNNQIPPGTYYYLLEVKVDGTWKHEKGYFVVRY
ncbi:MAG: Ig-like domain-containing protein [Pseudosphingobacterium sp.]|nr:Ig-like domain-containing protein [Pseudosphingobacterium sp.]